MVLGLQFKTSGWLFEGARQMDNVTKAKIIVAVTMVLSVGLAWMGFKKFAGPRLPAAPTVERAETEAFEEEGKEEFLPEGVIEVDGHVEQPRAFASNEPQILQIALDRRCLAKKATGDDLLLSVKGTKLVCDGDAACEPYEQSLSFSMSKTQGKRIITQIPVDLDQIAKSLRARWGNLMLGVVICDDTNHNGKCDETPIYQALRMNGRYLEAANYSGVLAIHLLSDTTSAVASCSSI